MMNVKTASLIGVALVVATILYGAASCLTPDTSRNCGPDTPCYQGEICLNGRCVDRNTLSSDADTSLDADTVTDGVTDTDTGVAKDGVDAAETDAGSPGDSGETRAGLDVSWPDGGAPKSCRDLRDEVSDGLRPLVREWRQPDATSDGGPGTECNGSDETCTTGKCGTEATPSICAHRFFTSSTEVDGDLGGLRGADCLCQKWARDKGRSGTWQAFITVEERDVLERIEIRGPTWTYRSPGLSADKIGDQGSGPIGSGATAPRRNEAGERIKDQPLRAWTGSFQNIDCNNWWTASGGVQGWTGYIKGANPSGGTGWWEGSSAGRPCSKTLRVYCIQQ